MTEGEVSYVSSGQSGFRRFLYKYWRFWYLFVISIGISVVLAILYLKSVTPQYNVSISVLIKDIEKGPDIRPGNPIFKELDILNSTTSIEDEIEALRSVTLMHRVLAELGLQTSYFVADSFKKRELFGDDLPVRLSVKELSESAYTKPIAILIKNTREFQLQDGPPPANTYQFGQLIKRPYGTFTVLANPEAMRWQPKKIFIFFNNLEDMADSYSKATAIIQLNKKANVLSVYMQSAVPEKGKVILNKLIEVYNKENKEDRNLLAINTIHFIDDRLKDLTAELSEIEKSTEAFKRRNQVTDVRSEANGYLEESRIYNNQLSANKIQLDIAESLERYLSRQRQKYELVPSNLTISDPTLQDFIGKFNDLLLQRERMLRTSETTNPLVVHIDEQLASFRLSILENLRTVKRGLLITQGDLTAKTNTLQEHITQVPDIERQLNAINRQEGVKRNLYSFLLQKREESSLSLAATISNTRVIDPASASKAPVSPKKPVVYALAFILGLILPIAFITVPDLLSGTVRQRSDVSTAVAVPILGEIMHYQKRGIFRFRNRGIFIISQESQKPIVDQFRLIRSNLHFAVANQPHQVILVTSGIAKEGKTFFSTNLALSLSFLNKKVALLDLNFRNPGILTNLRLTTEVGVTDYLNGNITSLNKLLTPFPGTPNLSVIGTGPLPANAPEFIMNAEVGTLIAELRERFDYIIIDSAPVGKVADTFALANHIDTTLFVVRYNYTPVEQLDSLKEVHQENKLKLPLIVLNDARKENSYRVK
ncbi:GumC family protein [Spirosoma fluviale]|uniref:Capsular exopolysaccharide family n=1 Tax=Spirosoma fluviale TaxID=1597977 RepID=A0A286G4H6_9BACT|nr:polysaccharide biosynthesis tyrosine autokinase [Spirosoma fluviale]SOD90126.1 capsular exopolysaccharide family [Spirosoma fluviale]